MPITHNTTLPRVAYFCMEYGLHEEFRIYSGGLGILAGDHIKSAGDLKVPLVGVGLLWKQGYTTQLIDENGRPYDTFPESDYDFLKDTGVKVNVELRGRQTAVKVWMVDKYGNAPLYLLDTNLPENEDKWVTNQLYGGFSDDRIAQEIVLGIGGVRALRALGIDVDVYHFNEGHAVFAGVELIREKMNLGYTFENAWRETRKSIVFTTHTPIAAGNESHDHGKLSYWGAYDGLTYDQMKQLGGDPFGMTVAGLRLSRLANAVARLHGETSRAMWRNIQNAAPITSITNGVHRPTWQDSRVRTAYETGGDLWAAHMEAKRELINEIAAKTGVRLSAESLLVGFARRAAPYKRSDLIFRHPEIVEPLLRSGRLQLVFSGKAHPNDGMGKDIIANLVAMAKRYPQSVVFLENYDIRLGKLLTRGCDVWLNNPIRPLEASGTSGMKAAMNGVLNLSILDGWWPEGCEHGVCGWRIGDAYEGPEQDEKDHHALYNTLISEVLPTYYGDRDRWVSMMKSSIFMSSHKFSTDRMVMEYFDVMYTPLRPGQPLRIEMDDAVTLEITDTGIDHTNEPQAEHNEYLH